MAADQDLTNCKKEETTVGKIYFLERNSWIEYFERNNHNSPTLVQSKSRYIVVG